MRIWINRAGIALAGALALVAAFAGTASANTQIAFEGWIEDIAVFEERVNAAETPEEVTALYVLALATLERDDDLGVAMVKLATTTDNFVAGDTRGVLLPYMRDHLDRMRADPNIARSYFEGAVPENGYALPAPPYVVRLSRNRLSEVTPDQVRLFVATSGAGTPRPVTLYRESDGVWRVNESSSLFVGIYRPE